MLAEDAAFEIKSEDQIEGESPISSSRFVLSFFPDAVPSGFG
jgi:hypothetical protein